MPDLVALVVVIAFVALSAIHVYWALGGGMGKAAAVPELNSRPAFVPSARSTLAVAVGLASCAVLVAASAGLVVSSSPAAWVTWLSFVLALVLIARAVGDFRLVGFFNLLRGTRFARLDGPVYPRLCLVISLPFCSLALQ